MGIAQKNVVITSALRSAIGSFQGSLKNIQAHEITSIIIKEAVKKSKLKLLSLARKY